MKLLFSVLIASFYGLTIRWLYGIFANVMGIMGISFLFLVPCLIGYLTVILLPYKEEHTATGAFNRKRRRFRDKMEWDFEKDDWEKPGSLKISFLFMLPLLAGLAEGDRTSSFQELRVDKQVEIGASPGVVWNALLENDQSGVKKQGVSFSSIFGFPHHLNTKVNKQVVGGSRVATYEKGLTFMETIEKMEPGRLLVLSIKTDPTKISKAIMDEHIVIGGKHVKLLQDEYRLEELSGGSTRFTLSSRFSINTPFNWYAGLWSRWLMSEILQEELSSIQQISGK